VQKDLLRYTDDEEKKDLIYVYTAFLIGQYFSWTYILRRQAQFLRFSTEQTNKQLNNILDDITDQFSVDKEGEDPFMLWRGQQMAIGELMTPEEEKGQLYCMGFAAFAEKYKTEARFKKWFQPIESGIGRLVESRTNGNRVATFRLRRLQHLLIDLVLLLDPERLAPKPGRPKTWKVDAAHECKCVNCPGMLVSEKVTQVSVPPDSKLPEP
jgi:hypothetical protein